MTIRKGEAWGTPAVRPVCVRVARDDMTAATASSEPIVVVGGDLWAALGRPVPGVPGSPCTAVPVDRLEVTVMIGSSRMIHKAVSQVRVGGWLGRRRLVVATNVGEWGPWSIAPRAHPNDGFVHVMTLDGSMGWRERAIARRRARSGTHVPHPLINVERTSTATIERAGREVLRIDGRRIRRWDSARVRVLSDDLTVLI